MKEAAVVGLKRMLEMEPRLEELTDLPLGWRAWRDSRAHLGCENPNQVAENQSAGLERWAPLLPPQLLLCAQADGWLESGPELAFFSPPRQLATCLEDPFDAKLYVRATSF